MWAALVLSWLGWGWGWAGWEPGLEQWLSAGVMLPPPGDFNDAISGTHHPEMMTPVVASSIGDSGRRSGDRGHALSNRSSGP